jgi:hypothetical protein
MLLDAKRRILRVHRKYFSWKEGLNSIAHAKTVATVGRPTFR